MRITLNDRIEEFPEAAMSVDGMLKAMRYSFPLIIVKVNGALVERSAYATSPIAEGDVVEMYHLVSGG